MAKLITLNNGDITDNDISYNWFYSFKTVKNINVMSHLLIS